MAQLDMEVKKDIRIPLMNPRQKKITYTEVSKNLLRHLAKGEEVIYRNLTLRKEGDKLKVRGRLEAGEILEYVYKLEKGDMWGLSKQQIKRILSFQETPMFKTIIR